MWSKFTSSFKSRVHEGSESGSERDLPSTLAVPGSIRQRQTSNGSTSTSISSNATTSKSQGETLSKVLEQHPNLSVFQPTPNASPRPASPFVVPDASPSPLNNERHEDGERPPSPPKKGGKAVFKRMSHRPSIDIDTDLPARSASPFRSLSGLPKKVKSSLSLHGNGSQASLNRAKSPTLGPSPSQEMFRPSMESNHTRASQDTLRSTATTFDVPPTPTTPADPQQKYATLQPHHPPSSFDARIGGGGSSVRSILRDPNTPGTGQNVRFFSRDAYKVISPDESMVSSAAGEPTIESKIAAAGATSPTMPHSGEKSTPFLDTLRQAQVKPENTSPVESGTFPLAKGKKSRPSMDRVFSPLREIDTNTDGDASNVFDDPETEHIPKPPGLEGTTGQDFGINFSDFAGGINLALDAATSTPHRKTSSLDAPDGDIMFHSINSEEKSRKGDGTAFFSPLSAPFQGTGKASASPSSAPPNVTTFLPPAPGPSTPSIKSIRSRHSHSSSATSVTSSGSGSMFTPLTDSPIMENDENQPHRPNVLHKRSGSSSPLISGPNKLKIKPKKRNRGTSESIFRSLSTSNLTGSPEVDINDISSPNISFDSPGKIHRAKSEATLGVDPFSAEAKPFYPPTLIPPTPPRATASSSHSRNLSKEESVIFHLQSQLALQTDLCSQYQTDLASREETVDALEKKLRKLEEDEGKKRTVLKAWKKKVAELERVCRSMEDEVERSREDRAERSVMDEASGEAMRHMHRQIAELERTVEGIDKERQMWQARCDEMQAKLESAEEMERELRKGIVDARQEMDDMMGNTSVSSIRASWASAEEEVQRATLELQRQMEAERDGWRNAEADLQEERDQLAAQMEAMKREADELRSLLSQKDETLAAKDEQLEQLHSEVEAQWGRTEQTGETMGKMSRELADLREQNLQLTEERDSLEVRSDQLQVYARELESDKERLAAEWADLETQLGSLEEQKRRYEQTIEESQGSHSEQRAALEEQRDVLMGEAAELEARISSMQEEMDQLTAERDGLREDVDVLEVRTAEMEEEWTEAENRKSEVDNELQELWSARDELETQLSQYQDRVADLELKTTEQDHRISSLTLEHQFSKDQVAKLESDITHKSSELADMAATLHAKEDELEQLRDEFSGLSRDHSRLVSSQSRELAEQAGRAGASQKQLEELIRSQARSEAENNSLNDRVRSLGGELDRMRKLVHSLQHDSADKDLQLAQAKKLHEKDCEELRVFNIALDSKQQELELMKRNLGVRGTAGSTPLNPNATPASTTRRNSLVATPSSFARPRPSSIISRPSSVASDISTLSVSTSATRASAAASKPTLGARRPSTNETPTTARSASASAARTPTAAKLPSLNKSIASAATKAKASAGGASRPTVSRASGAGTPISNTKSTLGRSTSARPSLPSAPITPMPAHRKASSSGTMRTIAGARQKTASPALSADTSMTMSEVETTPGAKKIAVLS